MPRLNGGSRWFFKGLTGGLSSPLSDPVSLTGRIDRGRLLEWRLHMTLDEAVALSLAENLSRVDLTARLLGGDPVLDERARPLLERARETRALAAALGIEAVAWNDPRYPSRLLTISDCPPLLWYRGRLGALDGPAVAIVGARSASVAGVEIAERLAADLSARGVAVVSGLARGVDGAAHRGAVRGGTTVAVMASGADRVYPAEHEGLARDIVRRGLVISEYPPRTVPLPFRFPQRNRVISGLSDAVVVVEASERSGSLITAACALEQGREVMAVPGSVLGGRNRGGHALIRDGAKIVEGADDIVGELRHLPGWSSLGSLEVSSDTPSGYGHAVLGHMVAGQAYAFDSLAAVSGLAGPALMAVLSALELAGRVRRIAGGSFLRVS
ncbi:MAG TPA: DNA-processing protein DprA [Vicinamibacterales bacterium]|nr:DNA-processing protein DprA [Vicinamibacterales bacterium]